MGNVRFMLQRACRLYQNINPLCRFFNFFSLIGFFGRLKWKIAGEIILQLTFNHRFANAFVTKVALFINRAANVSCGVVGVFEVTILEQSKREGGIPPPLTKNAALQGGLCVFFVITGRVQRLPSCCQHQRRCMSQQWEF